MADRLGIGIIGAGDIAHSHLLAYRSRANRDLARVVAIADIDEARAKAQAATYEIERTYTDVEELLADPAVDAVSICTPPFLHVEQSVAALTSRQARALREARLADARRPRRDRRSRARQAARSSPASSSTASARARGR